MKDFVKGMIFALFVLPLLDSILQIVQQSTNHICTWIAAKTYVIKEKIEGDGGNGVAIGFQAPDEIEEYYEEDDE